ncbi:MAG TPA: hypothetical protein VHM22_05355, partial [Bradyrhizobium sp.]|nr:hypothetical protein [Bradyrhizobium sp.]
MPAHGMRPLFGFVGERSESCIQIGSATRKAHARRSSKFNNFSMAPFGRRIFADRFSQGNQDRLCVSLLLSRRA